MSIHLSCDRSDHIAHSSSLSNCQGDPGNRTRRLAFNVGCDYRGFIVLYAIAIISHYELEICIRIGPADPGLADAGSLCNLGNRLPSGQF